MYGINRILLSFISIRLYSSDRLFQPSSVQTCRWYYHTLTDKSMIRKASEAVKKTYRKMKSEQGKKLELKVIGETITCMLQRAYGTRRKRSL